MNLALVTIFFVIATVLGAPANKTRVDCSTYTCEQAHCRERTCGCGSYEGVCGCCELCFKCPEELCNTSLQDICMAGYKCVLDNPQERFETGGVGRCKHLHATSA
ncbi:8.6 kDa transglutaminase substrate-like [Haemaphysalis longicornis]